MRVLPGQLAAGRAWCCEGLQAEQSAAAGPWRSAPKSNAAPSMLASRPLPPCAAVHYARHRPEPHIMLFRRPKGYGTAQQVAVPMQQ